MHELHSVDDVKFVGCRFPDISGDDCDKTTEFRCLNHLCISLNKKCDFADDCGDMDSGGSDETPQYCTLYPGRCNFEVIFLQTALLSIILLLYK